MMSLVTTSEIEVFEQQLEEALRTGRTEGLDVIGYGEITIGVKLATPRGDFACKRLVPFVTRAAAEQYAALIGSYIEQLAACGLDIVETETPILERPGGHVLYCVQPLLAPGTLGPDFLRGMKAHEAAPYVRRIFEQIQASLTPSLAPDGQLSNWAFEAGRLRYFDVGTPFLRDEQGKNLLDFSTQTRALPGPIRVVVDRFISLLILDHYFSTRGQALDFLGNLIKEGLGDLYPPLIPIANEVFDLTPAITERDVRAHYKSDARIWALTQAARRADRWVSRNIRRKPYPYLLPPRIDRYG